MSPSLAALACLPLADRAAFVERHGQHDLVATIEGLKRAGSVSVSAVTPQRMAWAMAYNLATPDGATRADSEALNPRFLSTHSESDRSLWSARTTWDDVWAFYVRPHRTQVFESDDDDPASRTLLRELARSVGCEERDDWPWSAHPVDRGLAVACRDEVYQLSSTRVRGVLARNHDWRSLSHDIIGLTWLRAVDGAWGRSARKRFVAKSLISTWLCAIAIHTAQNYMRDLARQRRREDGWSDRHGEALVTPIDESLVIDEALNADFGRRLGQCIEKLGERDRRLLGFLLDGVKPNAIAAAERVSAAAISQRQQGILEHLRNCFPERQVKLGITNQRVLKRLREVLAGVGHELFPFLRKSPAKREP
jgi:RNA polymerase sigma factor (sigma-70 family)